MKIKPHKNPPLKHKNVIKAVMPIGNKYTLLFDGQQVILSEHAFNMLLTRFNATLSTLVGKKVWLTIEEGQIKNITE